MTENIYLEWNNLEYSIKKPLSSYWKFKRNREDLKILKNASGQISSGQLVVILGSSGAGKTTLLGAISQRLKGKLNGDILLNNKQISKSDMINISCFIPQFEISHGSLTAREHLWFMSELKMNSTWTKTCKTLKINELLHRLSLTKNADDFMSTLSGGEKKKLSIASELLTDPPIIFCDEPTTGLDSYNALSVIKTLQNITAADTSQRPDNLLIDKNDSIKNYNNINSAEVITDDIMEMENLSSRKKVNYKKLIICSIHQPTSDVFQCFTHIILMNAGEIIFQGSRNDAAIFFSKIGFQCPLTFNPAEFYIKLISEKDSRYKINKFKEDNLQIESEYNDEQQNTSKIYYISEIDLSRYNSNEKQIWIYQMYLLMKRAAIIAKRNWKTDAINHLIFFLSVLLYSLYFGNAVGGTQTSIQDVQGAIFVIIAETTFSSSYAMHFIIPQQLPILRREIGEHFYSLSAYYVGLFVIRIPEAIIKSFLTFLIFYGTNPAFQKSFLFYLQISGTLSLISITGNAYGFMIAGMFESIAVSSEVATAIDIIFVILGGIYINLRSVPFIKYISMFYFSVESISLLYWIDVTDIECPAKYNGSCLLSGTQVLQKYNYIYELGDIWRDYLGLIVICITMNIIGFIGIKKFVHRIGYY